MIEPVNPEKNQPKPQILLCDFSRVLLFPKDPKETKKLNDLYQQLTAQSAATGEKFNFFDYFIINQQLLDFFAQLKRQDISLYIFTTSYIQNDPAVRQLTDPIFSHTFIAKDLGLDKKDQAAYQAIAQKLKVDPCQILFLDDSPENLAAAQKTGIQVTLYPKNNQPDNDRVLTQLQAIFSER